MIVDTIVPHTNSEVSCVLLTEQMYEPSCLPYLLSHCEDRGLELCDKAFSVISR